MSKQKKVWKKTNFGLALSLPRLGMLMLAVALIGTLTSAVRSDTQHIRTKETAQKTAPDTYTPPQQTADAASTASVTAPTQTPVPQPAAEAAKQSAPASSAVTVPTQTSVTPPPTTTTPPATQSAPGTPVSDIAPEKACPGQASIAAYQAVLACMTSYARTAHGLTGVTANNGLMVSANLKAKDLMACEFSHTACGKTFNYWMAPSGYTCGTTAENIAAGQATPRDVFVSWMNSPGHRANILSAWAKSIGLGLQTSQSTTYRTYWVMQLGGC